MLMLIYTIKSYQSNNRRGGRGKEEFGVFRVKSPEEVQHEHEHLLLLWFLVVLHIQETKEGILLCENQINPSPAPHPHPFFLSHSINVH